MRRTAFFLLSFFLLSSVAVGEEDAMTKLKDETMAYFKPMSGKIVHVEGNKVFLSIGEKDSVKAGMRMKVLREGGDLIHPVTKEPLGKMESTVGKIEIKSVSAETSEGAIVQGDAKEGDQVRISETKVRVFFCQDKDIDWYLADEYYRKLKGTGRIEMVDTALETADEKKVLEEAKKQGTEAAILLTARDEEGGTALRTRFYWVSDGSLFFDRETRFDVEFYKNLKFGEEFFAPRSGEAVMLFDLPFGAQFIAAGDIAGDGKQEIVLDTGRYVRFYSPGADLNQLWEIKDAAGEHIWLDTIDLNKDGKDEVVVTAVKNDEVVSYIYGYSDRAFTLLWKGKYFLRRLGNTLIAQGFSRSDGFAGDIFTVTWKDGFGLGGKIKVPKGVNIYDFVFMEGTSGEKLVFAYDDAGFLNLYDATGTRIWRSAASAGGFVTTYKKEAVGPFSSAGEWSVKDRLFQRQREVTAVQRLALTDYARSLGYKSSRIREFWWNGFSMEEGVLVDRIKGKVLDYQIAGEKVLVLASPFMGIKFGNILKGENPLGVVLYIYSIKGR